PTLTAPITEELPLPAGDYVVQVVPPPGYKIVTEEDLNTADGNDLIPALPPSGCVGDPFQPQVPDVYDSPFDAFFDDGTLKPGGENIWRPLCDKKLVTLRHRQNAGVDFHLMTDNAVPIPGRIFGFLLDDLNIETNPNYIYYGEKRGIPHTSVGVRDFTGRLITMLETDQNGIFEVLLPSTYAADCPIPSGVCPQMYLVVGNDPGDPGNPSPHYNPNYQSITFVFDVWPGKTTYADVALFPITAFNAFPGSQFGQPAACTLPDTTPQLFAVSKPYGNPGDVFTITGSGFGNTPGDVTLDGASLAVNSWSDTAIEAVVPADTGPGQLLITAANGETSRTGLTFHVLGGDYNPPVVEVFPPATPGVDTPLQDAINAAAEGSLIVVNAGTYLEALTINKTVKLQGVGPGAPDGLGSGGTHLNQRFILNTIGINVTGVAPVNGFAPQIDGFLISGSRDEQDVGGGVHVDTNVNRLQISNNVIRSNGGNFGGGITIGLPYLGDRNNDHIRIHHNRILHNGGISLAGGIGIFTGSDNYEIDHNDICGNYSGEYGGGISHFGLSHNGRIHHNRIYYNNAFDEGGGIIIAGELPMPPEVGQPLAPTALTDGAGAVDITNNLIQGNLSNDDGGGIRLLQPLDYRIRILNNIVVNNASTDMGGGISLDDASNVIIINNTIAKNANTSTAEDSDGLPHAAGLVSEGYSFPFTTYLRSTYGTDAPGFPDPVMFNNLFWDNQAYTWDGLALNFDSVRDIEVFGVPGTHTYAGHPTNLFGVDPLFVSEYDTQLNAVSFRMEPNFVDVRMVTVNLPPDVQGDYHLQPGSPAIDAGLDEVDNIFAPCDDIDDDERAFGASHDAGADEAHAGEPPVPGACALNALQLNVSLTAPNHVTAEPGSHVTLNYNLSNTGNTTDTYDLSISVVAPQYWNPGVDPISATLIPGEGTGVAATLVVPSNRPSGTVATVYVTATSRTDPNLHSVLSDTVRVVYRPIVPVPPAQAYLSLRYNRTYGGSLAGVRNEDVIGWDGTNFFLLFDGNDVGIRGLNIDAVDVLTDAGAILMSFRQDSFVPNVDGQVQRVDNSDIVKFIANSFGNGTNGSFTLFFDGSLVGLTTFGEDVDGADLLPDGSLLISTRGGVNVPADTTNPTGPSISGRDEDILRFTPHTPGDYTSGTWEMYFDGSNVGLREWGSEDVNGLTFNGGSLYLTTRGNISAPGAPAALGNDIFVCALTTTGLNSTTCAYNPALFFQGNAFGLGNNVLNAIDIP
ncbi:MAG: hypothetical protein D6796_07430, partial [Caldilineae bacterium]